MLLVKGRPLGGERVKHAWKTDQHPCRESEMFVRLLLPQLTQILIELSSAHSVCSTGAMASVSHTFINNRFVTRTISDPNVFTSMQIKIYGLAQSPASLVILLFERP